MPAHSTANGVAATWIDLSLYCSVLFDLSIYHQFIAQTATPPECLVVINSGWLNALHSVPYKGASPLRQRQLPEFHQGVEQFGDPLAR